MNEKKAHNKLANSTITQAKPSIVLGYLALGVLIFGFGGWSVTTSIAGAIIALGQVELENNRQVVQHLAGGIVGEIFVQEGAKVQAGQVLLRLDDVELRSELAIINSQYFELIARRGRLTAEQSGHDEIAFDLLLSTAAQTSPKIHDLLEGQRLLFVARRESFENEIAQLVERKAQIGHQLTGLSVQSAALSEQNELIAQELADQQALLEKGLTPASRVLALRRERARLAGALGEITALTAQYAGGVIDTNISILRLRSQRRETAISTQRELKFRENELAETRLLILKTLARLDVRAPASGTVFGLQVFVSKSVVQAGAPLMYIIPLDQPVVITSKIDPLHVDQVFVGQSVVLRFTGFDQRTTPELAGEVTKISADIYVDEITGRAFYQAEITPDPNEIPKLGERRLLPGMPVESFIRTTDRTPLEYLIKPLAEYVNKTFREG